MSKEKVRDLIICLLTIGVLVLTIATNVFATDDDFDLESELGVNNNNTFNLLEDENCFLTSEFERYDNHLYVEKFLKNKK